MDRPVFEECLLVPYGAEEPKAERLLVLAPHPDDEVLGCGGLVALTVRARGCAVALVLTDGAAGNFSGAEEVAAYVATRREESRRAARALGAGEPVFLDFPDRSLAARLPELVEAVAAAARERDATVLVAPSPAETHPDHRAAARAAYEAFLRLPGVQRLAFYEVSAALAPNRLVAVDAVEGLKEEACRTFESQLRERPFVDLMAGLSRYRATTLPPGVTFAEAFFVVDRAEGPVPTWDRLVRRVGPERPAAGRPGPRLSVVIPTFNRKASLERVLSALEAQRGEVPGGVEVVVVDDGSRDGTAGFLEAFRHGHPGTAVLAQENAGPARARNRGVAAASGEVVVFLGDDTVPEPGFLAVHDRAQRLAGDGPVAVLGYTGWDGERMRVTPFLTHLNEMGAQFGYSIVEDPDDVPFNFFYTSNVSLPRSLFLALGGFDEEFPGAAWEDVEFAYRACRLDPPLRLVYRPRARTRHDHPTTVASFRRRQYGAGKNGALFARKHPELLDWLGVREVAGLPDPRPFALRAKDAAIRLLDPLGVRLPGRWYDEVLRWDYVLGLRDAGLR